METMITLLQVTQMLLLYFCFSRCSSSSLLKLPFIAIYWATGGTYLWNYPSLSKKRQNGGRLTQKARVSRPLPLHWGPTFMGRGRVTSVRLANRFGTRFGKNTKLLRGVIRPISTRNDYLNTVFDDVVCLRGSCRKTVPTGKASTCCSSLPAWERSFLTEKEYANCVGHPPSNMPCIAMRFKWNIRQK